MEVVDGLNVSRQEKTYAGRNSAAYDSLAFRLIAVASHPDRDTLTTFRHRFLDNLAGIFILAPRMAQEMKLLELGLISLDETKIHTNASRHSAPFPMWTG